MPSRAGTEASFRRGSQIAPGGFLCPGPTVLARDAKASQHRAEFLPSLLAFLLPPPKKNGGAQGVEEASIFRRSTHFTEPKLNSQGKGGGKGWRAGK